ncbi:MAG TPA: universal stress protein [Anaerolineaceae bacterium]|nr:universal stress protein [Anaerolineaceae bacterium]HPN53938.1 universal stress protein [Anaerolineaceae bacterium]
MSSESLNYHSALNDFRDLRSRASLERLLARLTGRSMDLLPFDDISRRLRLAGGASRGLQDIPLDAIVGTVGREGDFTRDFLPLKDSDGDRWARVKLAMTDFSRTGLDPIDVYKIGDVYFVKDGHHRVSVARGMKATHIQAYVTEMQTRVPLTPDISPRELIIKEEYAEFLSQTHFDDYFPGVTLTMTVPGNAPLLLEHISVHRYYMGVDFQREISMEEAVRHWYEQFYLPVVQMVRQLGVMREFPGYSETDLYLWVLDHREQLAGSLGWRVRAETAAADLVDKASPRIGRIISRLSRRVLDALTPDELEDSTTLAPAVKGPLGDQWLQDILVPVSGRTAGWHALELAAFLAEKEGGANLHGLYVVPSERQADSLNAQQAQAEFDQRCQALNRRGTFALASGEIARQVCAQAVWMDLVVLSVLHPPSDQLLARLSSGLRTIIRRCPRPILAVPECCGGQIERLVLAYDGSPKAHEALTLAAYMASRWQFPLKVVMAGAADEIYQEAGQYLQAKNISANFINEKIPAADLILQTARAEPGSLVLMGSYGAVPVLELVTGSTVDRVLRQTPSPVLICQ